MGSDPADKSSGDAREGTEERRSLEVDEPLPPQRPVGGAARSPVGQKLSRSDKTMDTLAVVVGPLLIPAAVIAAIRSEWFSLGDVAFGVVAVAFAALTRALTGRGDSWKIVSAISIGALTFGTAIAVSRDVGSYHNRLTEATAECPIRCNKADIEDLVAQIVERSPGLLDWGIVVVSGLVLCTTVLYAIWRES